MVAPRLRELDSRLSHSRGSKQPIPRRTNSDKQPRKRSTLVLPELFGPMKTVSGRSSQRAAAKFFTLRSSRLEIQGIARMLARPGGSIPGRHSEHIGVHGLDRPQVELAQPRLDLLAIADDHDHELVRVHGGL